VTTLPAATVPARRAARPGPPLTPGRGVALLTGVPVAALLIAITGFQFVGAVGRASFPVSRARFPVPGVPCRFTSPPSSCSVN
jgi:hypothetical protein